MLKVMRNLCARFPFRDVEQPEPIYLISAAGHPNFGDEFIARSWLDWLAEHHPQREVWLDCMEPGRAAHLFRDTHPRLRTTNTLWQMAHGNGPSEVHDAAQWIEAMVTGLGSPKNDLGLRQLRAMSSIHVLGGGYMNTIWSRNLAIVAAITAVKRHYGVKVFATGQGLLPHEPSTRDWMRDQLAQFDYVESRDHEGASIFDIHLGTDDAFLAFANKRPIYAQRDSLPPAMVLIQGDLIAEGDEASLAAHVRDFVADVSEGTTVGFAEAIPPDDTRFAQPHLGERAEFFPFLRMWDEGFPAFEGQKWLTSRFHFHLLAAAAGAQGTVVNVRPGYYDVKHDLLLRAGTGWSRQPDSTGKGDVLARASASASFPQTARTLGAQKAELAKRLYSM